MPDCRLKYRVIQLRALLGDKFEDKQFPAGNEAIGDLLLGALGVDEMEWPRLSESEGAY